MTYQCLKSEIPSFEIYYLCINEYHHNKHILVNMKPVSITADHQHRQAWVGKGIAWANVVFIAYMQCCVIRNCSRITSLSPHVKLCLFISYTPLEMQLRVSHYEFCQKVSSGIYSFFFMNTCTLMLCQLQLPRFPHKEITLRCFARSVS